MRFGKLKRCGIALPSQLVDDGSTRITQPHYFRTLVDSLASRIVDCLSQHLNIVVGVHLYDLRIAATNQQTEEGKWRNGVLHVGFLNEMGQHMPLQMVHIHQRNTQGTRETFGETYANKQRTH